jgi:nucleotidyltransferase substrate binding protein (TIGR01987 family)
MDGKDIRWKQRFQNFCKVFKYLETALSIESPDIVQKAGIIQFFEMTFELSWKLLKDYLENQGFSDVLSPRNAIKKAFEVGLIEDGNDWMDLLIDRNLTTHTYDEQKVSELEKLIKEKYFPLFNALKIKFDSLAE